MFRLTLSSILIAALFMVSAPVEAQFSPDSEPLTISVSPARPAPYQTVTITLASSLIDLPSSELSITADGVVVSTSRTAQVTMGGPGSSVKIVGKAVATNGTYQKEITLRPAQVALITEANTTAHPFYKGARLVAPESRVRIIAVPDLRMSGGARIANKDLAFTWKLGDQVLFDQSGLGKNILTANAPVRYRDAQVSLTVASKDGSVSAQSSVYISPADPFVRVYTADPLKGVDYANAHQGPFSLIGAEETFRAVPYFFRQMPSLTWTLNGTTSGTEKNVTVRTSEGSKGTASLGILATDAGTGESAKTSFTLRFGERATNIFGF